MIVNVNRDPKKTRAFRASDFNPFAPKRGRGIPLNAETISVLKDLFAGPTDGSGRNERTES